MKKKYKFLILLSVSVIVAIIGGFVMVWTVDMFMSELNVVLSKNEKISYYWGGFLIGFFIPSVIYIFWRYDIL